MGGAVDIWLVEIDWKFIFEQIVKYAHKLTRTEAGRVVWKLMKIIIYSFWCSVNGWQNKPKALLLLVARLVFIHSGCTMYWLTLVLALLNVRVHLRSRSIPRIFSIFKMETRCIFLNNRAIQWCIVQNSLCFSLEQNPCVEFRCSFKLGTIWVTDDWIQPPKARNSSSLFNSKWFDFIPFSRIY